MPWELSSVLSRLRARVVRRSTAESSPAEASVPLPEALEASMIQRSAGTSSAQHLPIARKILQDPSSYLDVGDGDSLSRGLMPSTRRYSVDGSSNDLLHIRRLRPISDHPSEGDEFTAGSSAPDNPPPTQSRFIKHVPEIAAGGAWSTFGRNREHQAPNVVDFPGRTSPQETRRRISYSLSLHRTTSKQNNDFSTESLQSTFTLSRLTNRSRPSTATHEVPSSSPSTRDLRHSPDNRSSSKCSSPTNTMSSRRYPRTPQRSRSYAGPISSHETSSAMHHTSPVTREFSFDSPRTFGYPTPPDNPSSFSFTYSSPPPPMPPLDHPELAAALSSRRKSTFNKKSALPAPRDRSNTLPGRLSRKDDLLSSLSFTFGRSVRHQSSLPRVQQVFNIPMSEQHELRPPDRPRRARTVSGRTRRLRRTSADWSSHQATVGVNSYANQAWPAEVSREILRLSLGEGLELSSSGARSPGRLSGSSAKNKSRSRGDSTHLLDPAKSPSFLPFPHPQSPAPLKEPATLSGGREIIPSRPYSLQFDLGNRRDSEQPVRTTMAAEVKRSLSAVEARNGPKREASGAKHASSSLGDPETTTPKTPQVSRLLHPSSAHTPPPSRALFPGPPTPASNIIVSTVMDEAPSTPTPVSRHLSDKSRGKRKAEDVDLTPPDQKKESQRPTFVLPSESRSQRISNSSHAPSSYHRKRARLSSTSPFATPLQSRPPSVQEKPHSGSNNNHFASLSSSTGARMALPLRTPSRAASIRSQQPQNSTRNHHERHQSMSQVSIPISAFVSPHAPSISKSTKFHMRDPRKPPKKPDDTEWGLCFATDDKAGSPLQAWCFFLGFILFPVWWMAGLFLRIPKTRVVGDADVEKAVTIDDPQIEHDAKSWRFRCRVMAVVSLFTYIPFIILIAILVPR